VQVVGVTEGAAPADAAPAFVAALGHGVDPAVLTHDHGFTVVIR